MHPLAPLPAELQDRPFNVREADALGIPRSRLRRSDLETPLRGVRTARARTATPPKEPWMRFHQAVLDRARQEFARLPAEAALSHTTAAVIHGFPVRLHRLQDPLIHITSESDAARRRRAGLKVHPLPRDERRVIVKGLRLTHPVDTWCALSAILTLDELIEIGDHLVRRQHPDATLDELHLRVRNYAGRRGAKRLRVAVDLVRERTDSPKETELRLVLLRAELPEPTINASVRDRRDQHIKLGDLVYEGYHVLVEFDGDQHRTDTAQYEKDAADLERAASAGWLVIRVRNRHLRQPGQVAARVAGALRSRGWPGASTFTDGTRRLGEA